MRAPVASLLGDQSPVCWVASRQSAGWPVASLLGGQFGSADEDCVLRSADEGCVLMSADEDCVLMSADEDCVLMRTVC